MNTKDYISAIAIERLLEDRTLPADIRMQAEQVLREFKQANFRLKQQYWEDFSGLTEEAIEQDRFNRHEE